MGSDELAVRVTVHAGDRIDGLIKGGDGLIEASTATWTLRRPPQGQQHASCEFAAACGMRCRVVELELDCGRTPARSLLLHRLEIVVDESGGGRASDGASIRAQGVPVSTLVGRGSRDYRSTPSSAPSPDPASPPSLLRRLDVADGTAERFGPLMRLRLRKEVR